MTDDHARPPARPKPGCSCLPSSAAVSESAGHSPRRSIIRLSSFVFSLLLLCFSARADVFDDLRLKWRDLLTGGTNLNLADPAVASRVASIGNTANNRWSSMNQAANRAFLWSDAASTTVSADLVTTYSRLRDMALGWATTGSAVFSNATLAADIVVGLDWAYANRYNENSTLYDNWWSWEIGVPHALNDCLVLMYPVLSGAQITNFCKPIDKFTPNVSPSFFGWTMTGANRVWKAEALAVRGAVGRNSAKLAAARDGLSAVSGGVPGANSVFKYVTSGDGFYADGSFIQHGRHPYTGGYGLYLFRDAVPMLGWLSGSPWAVTDPEQTNVVRWAFDSFEPFLYRGALVEHLRGREISRSYSGFSVGRSALNAMLRLAQTAPPAAAARLRSLLKYMDQADTTASLTDYVDLDQIGSAREILADTNLVPRGELIGHFQFPGMDRVMHLRPGFGFGLSLSSARIYNYESINGENHRGWYTSEGMTYLLNSDLTQFTDAFWPTVDPYRLPGTTVALNQRTNGSGRDYLSPERWVGGASLANGFGAAGMALKAWNSTLTARKSWFLFDNEIVCLGAGISGGGTNVITTIENRRLNSAGNNVFTADGVAHSTALGWNSNFTTLNWCALADAGGYFFPGGAPVRAQRAARSGRWADLNDDGSASTLTRNYLTLWLEHALNPASASYAYVLLPNLISAEVAAYAAAPEIEILTNTPAVQAVRENARHVTAANFWHAAPATVDFVSVSDRASVLVQESLDDLAVAVADPTQTNIGAVTITLARSAVAVGALDPGIAVQQLAPTIQFTVSMNQRRGQSARATFLLYSTTPPLLAPIQDRTVLAGETLVVTNTATDGSTAPQRLAYRLDAAPAGAVIDANSGVITWTPDDPAIGAANHFRVVVTQAGWQTNLLPTADAFVRDGASFSSLNYGAESSLAVKHWLTPNSGNSRESFLRFELPPLRGTVTSAKLSLRPRGMSQPGAHAVAETDTDTWQENSLTWANRPGGAAALATWTPALNTSSEAELGPRVQAALFGAQRLSLRIFALTSTADGLVNYGAREGDPAFAPFLAVTATNLTSLTATQTFHVTVLRPPQPPVFPPLSPPSLVAGATLTLAAGAYDPDTPPQRLTFALLAAPPGATIHPDTGVITWRPPQAAAGTSNLFTVVATQAGWQTNLAPVADAYVRDGSAANMNYGADTNLQVKRLAATGQTRESHLRFLLPPDFPLPHSATLRLVARTVSQPGVHAVSVVTNANWDEATLTWNTRPATGPPLVTWTAAAGAEALADVTAAAQAAIGNQPSALALCLFAANTTADGLVNYHSREAAEGDRPQLRLLRLPPASLHAMQSFWVLVTAPAPPGLALAPGVPPTFTLTGDAGPDYTIQATTNLAEALAWQTLFTTNSPALPLHWTDRTTNLPPQRFYRARPGP